MKRNRQGFTLIELLVVVLIIGILSAVALPQYQKTVEKARATEAISVLHQIAQANQRYFMANGEYASSLEDLDIEIPGTDVMYLGVQRRATALFHYDVKHTNGGKVLALANRIPAGERYYMLINIGTPDKIRCDYYTDYGKSICKNLSGNNTNNSLYYISY